MPPLSDQDREWVKAVAREVAFEAVKEVIATHINACPHGQKMARAKAWLVGVGFGVCAASGGLGYAIARLASP